MRPEPEPECGPLEWCRIEIDPDTGHAHATYRWRDLPCAGSHRHDEDVRDWSDQEIRQVVCGLVDITRPDDLARVQVRR